MRQLSLAAAAVSIALAGGVAAAAPFEARLIPEQAQGVAHLDVEALRRTQLFAAVGGQGAIDKVLKEAPADVRPLADAFIRSVRGVSFWIDGDDSAVLLRVGDSRAVAQLLAKPPAKISVKVTRSPGGYTIYAAGDKGDDPAQIAISGDTIVISKDVASVDRSLRVIEGKARGLAASSKLANGRRNGVFFLATLDDALLDHIQKKAQSKLLQLAIRSVDLDIGESAGVLTASARALMGTAEALQHAKGLLEGLRAVGALSGEPELKQLIDRVTMSTNGLTLEITAKLPVAQLAKMIEHTK